MNLRQGFVALGLLVGVAGFFGGAYLLGWKARDADWQAAIAEAKQDTVRVELKAEKAVTPYVARRAELRPIYEYIEQEAPAYVTPETDARYPLPWGFVRLHDAAAEGRLPPPPSLDDAEVSPVVLSDASRVIAGNYGVCNTAINQLTALQTWVSAVSGAPILPESGGNETPPL